MGTPRRKSRRVQKAQLAAQEKLMRSPIKSPIKRKRKAAKKVVKSEEKTAKGTPRIRLKSMVGRKRKIREDDEVPHQTKRRKSSSSKRSGKSQQKKDTEELPEGHFEILEFGPLYLNWIKYQEGDKKKYAIGEDVDHLIWVKWSTPENKDGEWHAEQQSIFESAEQLAIIEEIKMKKEIWPWVEDEGDGTTEQRKSILKMNGFKEYLHCNDKKYMDMGMTDLRDTWSLNDRQKVKETEKPNNNIESSDDEDDDDDEEEDDSV